MADEVNLDTVDSHGVVRPVTLILEAAAEAHIKLVDEGTVTLETSGEDYLTCLVTVREHLEQQGRRLCCQGARPDVWPSGMLRQFSDGREAYVLDRATRGKEPEIVDIFAPAPADAVVTLSTQEEAVRAFHGLPARSSHPE